MKRLIYYRVMARPRGKKRFREYWSGFDKEELQNILDNLQNIGIETKVTSQIIDFLHCEARS